MLESSITMKYDHAKLKAAREKKLLTMTELAALTGLSVTTVHLVETGNAPWKKAIRRIASILGVDDVVIPTRRK